MAILDEERLRSAFHRHASQNGDVSEMDDLLAFVRDLADMFLSVRCHDNELRRDIVQEVTLRFAERASNFEFRSIPEFKAYIRKISEHAWHLAFKKYCSRRSEADSDTDLLVDGSPSPETEALEKFERRMLCELADEALLGKSTSGTPRKVIGVQLLLQGIPECEVIELLKRNPHAEPIDETSVNNWPFDYAVVRRVATNALYFTREELTSHVLRNGSGRSIDLAALINELTDQTRIGIDREVNGWQWDEARAIIYKYRYSLPNSRIVELVPRTFDLHQLTELFKKFEVMFPFENICRIIGQGTCFRNSFESCLSKKHVWQRLAFEYWYIDELPQDDILALIQPAATSSNFRLTVSALKIAWLSSHRLLKMVADVNKQETEEL